MVTNMIKVVAKGLTEISSLWLFAIMILVGSDVFMRYVFNAPIPGTLEISEQTVVIITFLCFAYTGIEGRHVRTTAIVGRFPYLLRRIFYVLSIFLMAILLTLLVWQTSIEAWRSLSIREIRMGLIGVPLYPTKIAIPISLSVAWLYYSLTFLGSFKRSDSDDK